MEFPQSTSETPRSFFSDLGKATGILFDLVRSKKTKPQSLASSTEHHKNLDKQSAEKKDK